MTRDGPSHLDWQTMVASRSLFLQLEDEQIMELINLLIDTKLINSPFFGSSFSSSLFHV